MELKIPNARVEIEVPGKKMWLWVDSGSPVTIFSMTDLKSDLTAPETSHYDENFTLPKIGMINATLYPRDQSNPRGQTVKNKIQKIPAVEGLRTCVHSRERVASNQNIEEFEYAKDRPNCERSQEGVVACNLRSANQKQDIYIPKDICKLRNKQNRRCSQSAKYNCLFKQDYQLFQTYQHVCY